MTSEQRRLMEERVVEFKAALNDPWRLLRDAERGIDPVVTRAITLQYEALIAEMEQELADDAR